MLFLYALVPVFELMVLCVVLVLCVGSFFVITRNKKTNREVADTVGGTLASYGKLLEEFRGMPDIVDLKTSTTKRQTLMRKLYTVSVETGYEAEFYILDQDFRLCVSTRDEEAEGEVVQTSDRKWKVLEKLLENPEDTALYVQAVGSDKKIVLGSAVWDGPRQAGYAVLAIPGGEFSQLLSGSIQKNLITDGTGWVYAAGSYNLVDAVGRLERRVKDCKGFFTFGNGCYYSSFTDLCEGGLRIYTMTDNTDMIGILDTVMITGVFLFLCVLFISLSSAERMAVKSTADIRTISDTFQDVTGGNMDAYLDIHSSEEFENIGNCYNHMLNSLKQQISANKELAETVAFAQVKQLESQFNSHFLFNTLDNIRFMCRIDPELAEFMTISLSELLRYNTSNANEKVTVEEDLKYIRIYLDIIKVRFAGRLDYQIEAEDEVLDAPMPKLLLQPVIENSIKYGFGTREHLTMWVRVGRHREDGDRDSGSKSQDGRETLVFSCEDDGEGIAPGLLEKLLHNLKLPQNGSTHMGLYNVHRRVQLMYGGEYGMEIGNRVPAEAGSTGLGTGGVRVTVRLPYETDGEEREV